MKGKSQAAKEEVKGKSILTVGLLFCYIVCLILDYNFSKKLIKLNKLDDYI